MFRSRLAAALVAAAPAFALGQAPAPKLTPAPMPP